LAGATKTVGVPAAWTGGKADGDNANIAINIVGRRTAAIGSLEFLLFLFSSNDPKSTLSGTT